MGGRSTVCSRGHISWFMVNVDDGFSRRLQLNQTPELTRTSAIPRRKAHERTSVVPHHLFLILVI